MCEFTYAGVVQGDYPTYLAHHPKTNRLLNEMAKVEGSVLTATYWGILPFGAGQAEAVKYRLDPETPPQNVANDAPDYLAVDLKTTGWPRTNTASASWSSAGPTRRPCRSTKRRWNGRNRRAPSSRSPP